MANVDNAVKKSVKGKDWIEDEDHDRNKILLGLGCVLVAIGTPLVGYFGKQVDKGRKQRK